MSDAERDKVMVQELLVLKTKMDEIIAKAFQESMKFNDVLRESFESVINRRQNKPAELIGVSSFSSSSLPSLYVSIFPSLVYHTPCRV